MAELRAALAELPLHNISTVLATGNVLCDADASANEVKALIETGLSERFDYDARVVALTTQRLTELVTTCLYPADSQELHAYVTFSSDPEVLTDLFESAGGESNKAQMRLGPEAVAWQVEVGRTLDSVNNKLTAKPKYKHATTTRNLRTLLKVVSAGTTSVS